MAIPATSFRPPSGFGELTPDASDFSAEALEKFSGDLAGKQVWHITAPVSVPLASIREFDLEGLRNGHPILSHNQRQYGFSTSTTDSEGLLLPEGRSSTYKRLKTCKLQSYHLREILNHSNAGGPNDKQGREAVNFFAKEVPLSKPAPKQPETLRMRYTPFGTDRPPSTSTSTHRDPTVAENHFQVSTPLSSPPHESTAPPKSTPRKKKKDKMKKERNSARSGPNDEDGLENDPMEVDGSPASATTVQRPASQTEPSLVETATLTGDVDGDKLVSEKKKRKKKIREEGSS